MTETAQMRTWAEISLDRLAHNYQTLRAMLAPDCRFLGLCKANAYGHGALQVGRKLEALGVRFKICHCAASAAVLNYPCTHMDMVRPGIALYGYYPAPGLEGLDGSGLLPVMALKTRVAAVRAVPAGTCVSYGCTARLERDSRLAVLPVGYGDGYPRLLSNRMEVLLRGRRCPVVGRICMDMCMVDVTDVPDAVPGDVAELYGREGLLEQAAALAGTIPYELLCNVNPRVPRIYTGRGGVTGTDPSCPA